MSVPVSQLPPNGNRGHGLIVQTWTTVSIASLLVFVRVYTRAFLRRTAGADDWTIAIALAFAVAQSILVIFQVDNGFGKHIEYLQPNQIRNVLLITTILEVLHTIGTFLVRVSVCLFVLRLVPPTHQEFYKYTYVLIAFFTVISTATFMIILLACIPIQGTWDREIKARCIARSTLEIIAKTQGAFATLMDLLCVCLPIFFLRNLQVQRSRKISLFVFLGLGLFTAACAVRRTIAINFQDPDFTYGIIPVASWASLEQNIGIIVASAPALYQLYTVLLEKYFPDHLRRNSYPVMRSLKPHVSQPAGGGYTEAGRTKWWRVRLWPAGGGGGGSKRGSLGVRMMEDADGAAGAGAGVGGMTLPGPPSPTKKAPRTDYDKASLDLSPRLEQAVTGEAKFS